MINNAILEGYLNCKYKPCLIISGSQGNKKDYEIMQNEILQKFKSNFKKLILERYGEKSIMENFQFNKTKRNGIFFAFETNIKDADFDVTLDAIEIKNKSVVPILLIANDKIHKKEKIYLAVQTLILSKLTKKNFETARIFYGDEFKTLKIKLSSYIKDADKIIEELEKITKKESQPKICKNDCCKTCEFEELCYAKLIEKDDLSLLSSIRQKEKPRFEKKGIFTVNQLSYTFKPRKKNEWVKQKEHPFNHSLQALAIREKKVYVYDEVKIPKTKTKVFVDLEGNSDGSFIYLIGVLVKDENKEKFYSFWADYKENEKDIFKKFAELLGELEEVSLFHYGKYDQRVFKRIFSSSRNKKVKEIVINNSTDILKSIRRNIYFPTYSNSLKEIGSFLGYNWSKKDSSGLQSIFWRWKWDNSMDEKIKDDLIQYNKDDCLALGKVVEFINNIFDKTGQEDIQNNNIAVVESPKEDENRHFKNMTYAINDIEIITKGAYFEYQRNKVFFRTNDNLKKIKKKGAKKLKDKFKINQRIIIRGDKCPFCKSSNIVVNELKEYKKICFDIKFFNFGIKRWNTCYITFDHRCKSCKRHYVPKKFKRIYLNSRKDYHPKYDSVLKIQKGYGHNLLAFVINQSSIDKTTFRNIEKNLYDYFNFTIDHRHLWWFKILASQYYKETYQKIVKKLISGNLIHADETKAKMRDRSGYVWVFTNMEEVLYLYKPNREAGFLHNLLKEFKGVLITDFYPGYDSIDCPQQKCLVHLLRDLNDDLLKNPFDENLKWIVTEFSSILKNIVYTTDKYGLKNRYMKKHKKHINRFFKSLKKLKTESEISEIYKKRLIAYEKELFLFLGYDNIPWNNNNVEHAIKHFANYRQTIKGSATENGLESYLILLSIYKTCDYKGLNFMDFLLSKEIDIDLFMEKCKNKKYRSKIRQ